MKHTDLKASLSIEAALILPVFIYAVMAVMSVINFIGTELRVREALYNTAMSLAKYEYAYETVKANTDINLEELEDSSFITYLIGTGIEIGASKVMVVDYIGEDWLDKSYISGGASGLKFWYSDILNEQGIIDLVVTYELRNPYDIFGLLKLPVTSRARVRVWKGDKSIYASSGEEDEKYVYITENGLVYHTDSDCTYIKRQIMQSSISDIAQKRNDSGAKYYKCDKCRKEGKISENVYFTRYGTRYHSDKNCSELERGIIKVKLSDVSDRDICSKCKGE